MKIFLVIFRWIFWFFGFSLTLSGIAVAILDDKSDRWISVITLIFFGLVLILIGYILKINKYNKKQNQTVNSQKESQIQASNLDDSLQTLVMKTQTQWQKEVKNYSYHKEQVRGKILQSLESMEIIESTKNLDILQSRYSFLRKLFFELQICATNTRYPRDVQDSIDDYKQLYYDKIPHRTQLAGILKPMEFDIVAFGGISIFNCFMRHYSFQLEQIDLLKTESGKKGRYKKLLESIDKTSVLLRDEFIGGKDFEDLHLKLKHTKTVIEQKII